LALLKSSERLGLLESVITSEHFLNEAVYNLPSWVRDNDDRGVNDLIEDIDHFFHPTAHSNVQN